MNCPAILIIPHHSPAYPSLLKIFRFAITPMADIAAGFPFGGDTVATRGRMQCQ